MINSLLINGIPSVLDKLVRGHNLTETEIYAALSQLENDPDPCDIAAFLVLLKQKGETGDEIRGMLNFLKQKMIRVNTPRPALDIVGTGGDGAQTVNISTGSAILAASCGVLIAKHGNRSVSSKCGSADLIEALKIPLIESPEAIENSLKDIGIAFLYAPYFNPVLKKFQAVRKRLAMRTVFNLLGPMLNPAEAGHLMVGTWDQTLVAKMAEALSRDPKIKKTLVFHGCGIDELSTLGSSTAILIEEGHLSEITINPENFGFKKSVLKDLQGGTPEENKQLLLQALKGKPGAISDTIALNAGTALWLYGDAATIPEGIKIAAEALKNGLGIKKVNEWIHYAQ